MADIIPAVLPKTFDELESTLVRIAGVSPLVQIDVVEPDFFGGRDAMPQWEVFDFEFDSMVPHPEREVAKMI